jgi:hypothetical protein
MGYEWDISFACEDWYVVVILMINEGLEKEGRHWELGIL